jgi:DNA invertase Pin-like site-specific DNA recombinase
MVQMIVSVAEMEAGMISKRTKDALAQAKKRGVRLGGYRGAKPTAKMRACSTAVVQQRADARAVDLASTSTSDTIAAGLNAQGIPTPRGQGQWSAVQVQRVLDRLGS